VDARDLGVELSLHLGLRAVLQELIELERAVDASAQLVVWVEPIAQRFHFLQRRLRLLLVVPEAGIGHLSVECAQAGALTVDVKDTSAARPVALCSASDRDRVRFPPFTRAPEA
jgi:hypothetical protein